MNTNTMMLIALALIVVLAAVSIWLANRGSGITDTDEVVDEYDENNANAKLAD